MAAPNFVDVAGDYAALWESLEIRPERAADVSAAAAQLNALKSEYDKVTGLTNVPWFVVGLIHSMEAGFKMNRHLHNGDPLGAPTTHEPKGRPKTPPFDWIHSAVDALQMKALHKVDDWTIARVAYALEGYNGWGYRKASINIHSPYLWSFTNHYTRGKFVADHVYDPAAVSEQVGAMALLKKLVQDGFDVGSVGGNVDPPAPPPPPADTGIFELDGLPFILRPHAGDPSSAGTQLVTHNMPVRKVAEVDADWWQIQVTTPTGNVVPGFAKREWLRPVFAPFVIDEDHFTQACMDAARHYGTSAHFLIALAYGETKIGNAANPEGPFGPFAYTVEEWKSFNDPAETGLHDAERFDPYSQPAMAARMTVKLTADVSAALPGGDLPTSEQLNIARVVGPEGLKAVLAASGAAALPTVLAPGPGLVSFDEAAKLRPSLLNDAAGPRSVESFRLEIRDRLDKGLAKAGELILKVEPDLAFGPTEASADGADVPWMNLAKGEIGQKEGVPPPSNPRIEEYFVATTLGQKPDSVPWCGAFTSWCIRQAGGNVTKFSALASDWLNNGEKLPGPEYGAIAVLRPLVPESSGHVAFVLRWVDGKTVTLLGGNQDNQVKEEDFSIGDVRGWRKIQ